MTIQGVPDLGIGLRLHLNENTGGCSPRVVEAVRAFDAQGLATYPDFKDAILETAAKDIDAVHVAKPHGQQHEIEVPPVGGGEAFRAAARRDHVVPFVDQGKDELLADGVLARPRREFSS